MIIFASLLGSFVFWVYSFFVFPVLCLASFALYALDKMRARSESRRIPEATLHMLDVFGGWPGGLVAQRMFRHKTKKTSYQVLFWASVVFHLFCCYVVYRAFYG